MPTLCLCMIVKNEAHVIGRCLGSVRPVIDSWVVVDTGSDDGTQEAVRSALAGLPGELVERPWVDFATNRNEALALARPRADYTLVIDADERLDVDPGFVLPADGIDSYDATVVYGELRYARKQIVRSALPWRYVGVLHEYLTCPAAQTSRHLDGVRTVATHDGARARDPGTYRRDALTLERALIDEPDDERNVFYLAQSWRDAGEPELALRWYRRRAAMGGWAEEVWFSLYQIGRIQEGRPDVPWPEAAEAYLRAWDFRPDRAEPLYRLGMHHQRLGQFSVSHLYLKRAASIPSPGPDRLFVDGSLYEVHVPLEYAVSCYYVGDHATAVRVNDRLLAAAPLTPPLREVVERNRRLSLDALGDAPP